MMKTMTVEALVAEVESFVKAEARKAARKSGGRVEAEDLEQVGRMAAMTQAARFDQTRGLKFITYALPLIQREVRRAAVRGGSVVSTSTVRVRQSDVSLSVSGDHDDDNKPTLGDTLTDGFDVEAVIEAAQTEATVKAIVSKVKWERFAERAEMFDAIVERLMSGDLTPTGLFTSDVTLADIASKHGMTREGVRRVELQVRAHLTAAFQQEA